MRKRCRVMLKCAPNSKRTKRSGGMPTHVLFSCSFTIQLSHTYVILLSLRAKSRKNWVPKKFSRNRGLCFGDPFQFFHTKKKNELGKPDERQKKVWLSGTFFLAIWPLQFQLWVQCSRRAFAYRFSVILPPYCFHLLKRMRGEKIKKKRQ